MSDVASTSASDVSRQETEDHRQKSHRGYLYIAAATFSWGISATLGRAAFTGRLFPGSGIRNISPLILSQCRTTFSFLIIGLGLLPRRGWKNLCLPWPDVARIFLLGVGGVAASNYFYYLAIQRTNVATAIIVQYTAPVWVLLYMVARGAERPTLSKISSVFIALVGIALVIGLFGPGKLHLDALGVAAALVAAFSFAFYNIGGHSILVRYDHWKVLLYTTMAASLFWIAANPPNRILAAHYSSGAWLFLLIFAILSVLVPFAFYFAGLQHLEPTKAIVVSCLEPVFSILIAAIALHEVVRPLQGLGILMVLTAIVIVQRPQRAVAPID